GIREGPADPGPDELGGRLPQQRGALEADRGRGCRVEAAQAVEQGRLARAVRPDQTHDLSGLDVERDPVQCEDAAEPDRDVTNAEDRHLVLRAGSRSPASARRVYAKGGGSRRAPATS